MHGTMEKLKACPFCGSSETIVDSEDDEYSTGLWFMIRCSACKATGPQDSTEAVAREKWDERPLGEIY
jgi:Lar family restriction alleviation protein